MEPLALSEPTSIGPYRLEGRLGAGGMGLVYAARSPGGRRVVVKVIRPEYAAAPGYRTRFAREVAAARRVGGFHTAQVLDADPDADSPWMATAYIDGPSLLELVRTDGPLPADRCAALAMEVAEGLTAIQACGLVHRDLKPGNIVVAADGARIIDFGIAKAIGASSLTGDGQAIGTYAYMSPEQVRAQPVGPAGDVFSFGALLYFAATGHGPFDADNVPAIGHRILDTEPDLSMLDGPLLEVIAACLAKAPEQRPSPADVLTMLGTAGDDNHDGDEEAPYGEDEDEDHENETLPESTAATTVPDMGARPTFLISGTDRQAPTKSRRRSTPLAAVIVEVTGHVICAGAAVVALYILLSGSDLLHASYKSLSASFSATGHDRIWEYLVAALLTLAAGAVGSTRRGAGALGAFALGIGSLAIQLVAVVHAVGAVHGPANTTEYYSYIHESQLGIWLLAASASVSIAGVLANPRMDWP